MVPLSPLPIWNVKKYLNIWVTDENIGAIGLLGYATFSAIKYLIRELAQVPEQIQQMVFGVTQNLLVQ